MPGLPGRWEFRYPDDSPMRHLQKNWNPPASVFDVSAGDPDDRFRPEHCPHCGIHKSGVQTDGYLCRDCNEMAPDSCKYDFRKAVAGICVYACGTVLTDEERFAQYCLCLACSQGQGREMQRLASPRVVVEVRQKQFVAANESFTFNLQLNLAKKGRCMRPVCGREMTDEDRYSNFLKWPERYIFCESCRNIIAKEAGLQKALQTTRVPIDSLITPPMPPTPKLVCLDKNAVEAQKFLAGSVVPDIPFLNLDATNVLAYSRLPISTFKDGYRNDNINATTENASQLDQISTNNHSHVPQKEYNDVRTLRNLGQRDAFLLKSPSVFDNLETWEADCIRPRQPDDGFVRYANVLPESNAAILNGQAPTFSPSECSSKPQEPELPDTLCVPAPVVSPIHSEDTNANILSWMDDESVDDVILCRPCPTIAEPYILQDIAEEQGGDSKAKNDPIITLDDQEDGEMNISYLPRAPPPTPANGLVMDYNFLSDKLTDTEDYGDETQRPSDHQFPGSETYITQDAHSECSHDTEGSVNRDESSSVSSSAILAMSRARILHSNPFIVDDSIDIYGSDDEKPVVHCVEDQDRAGSHASSLEAPSQVLGDNTQLFPCLQYDCFDEEKNLCLTKSNESQPLAQSSTTPKL